MRKYEDLSKYELNQKKMKLLEQLQEIQTAIDKRGQEFSIDTATPFKKWSLAETNELYELSPFAFEWFINDNQDKTILDFNETQPKEKRIKLAQ